MGNVRELSETYHGEGCNCSETIVKTFNDVLGLGLPEISIRMASGFGGGIGRSGCACGALTGSALIISALAGRVTTEEKPLTDIYPYVHEFHDRFRKKFGATCCRILNRKTPGTPEFHNHCTVLIADTAEMLDEFLREKKLVK